MKTAFKFFLFLSLFSISKIYSQSSATGSQDYCSSNYFRYSGPKNSLELEDILLNSNSSIITSLSAETKRSLITHLEFRNNFPIGLSGRDQNITDIFTDISFANRLLSEIFKLEVRVCTFDTKPKVINISLNDFLDLVDQPLQYTGVTILSFCSNCLYPAAPGGGCCAVGGNGCSDAIVIHNDILYSIK